MDPGLTTGLGRLTPFCDLPGRILIHAPLARLEQVADLIDPHPGGIVVEQRHRRAETLPILRARGRLSHHMMPILRDTAAYRQPGLTTLHGRFEISDSLTGTGLSDHLDQQIADGYTMALTPTRFIPVDDEHAPDTVIGETDQLGRLDTLCLLPLDLRWLSSRRLKRLDHALRYAQSPVAVVFPETGILDRNGFARKALDDLLGDYPDTCLLRGDLTVMSAVARHGGLGSIGVPRPVWFQPPPSRQRNDVGGWVLVPQLLQWLPVSAVQELARRGTVFTCDCPECHERAVHEIVDPTDILRHNVSRWMTWASRLRLALDKPAWWRAMCDEALEAFCDVAWDESLRPHHDRLRAWAR